MYVYIYIYIYIHIHIYLYIVIYVHTYIGIVYVGNVGLHCIFIYFNFRVCIIMINVI